MSIETMQPLKKPRSVELTRQERKALKEYRKRFESETECAVSLGLDRAVLNRALLKGSASLESVERIRTVLSSIAG